MKKLFFDSKTPDLRASNNPYQLPVNAARLLSNFAKIPVVYNGNTYPTLEHAFQGIKYLFSNKPQFEADFRVGGFVGDDPANAKYWGSRKAMKDSGATLNVTDWDEHSEQLMKELIKAKVESSDSIKSILEIVKANKIQLVHTSKSDFKWGASVNADGIISKGDNLLGKIYMQVAKDL